MDMKKLLNIVSGTTQLNESINECGSDMPPAPQTNPMNMSVNVSAQGIDQIRDLMGLFKDKDGEQPVQVPNVSGEITTVPDRDDDADMIMKLAGVRKESVTGGFDKATTMPDEEVQDVDAVVRSGNDLNRSKDAYAKAEDGDNPMAVHNKKKMEEGIRSRLRELYQEIKESKR